MGATEGSVAGQADKAPALLAGWQPTHVLADKDYDSQALVGEIIAMGTQRDRAQLCA